MKECVYRILTCELSGDLYNVMHKLSGHLQLIHANDNSGNYDDHKPPGEGNIDWKRLLTELSQIEFHGGFILEPAGNKEPELVLAEARGARRAAFPARDFAPTGVVQPADGQCREPAGILMNRPFGVPA